MARTCTYGLLKPETRTVRRSVWHFEVDGEVPCREPEPEPGRPHALSVMSALALWTVPRETSSSREIRVGDSPNLSSESGWLKEIRGE